MKWLLIIQITHLGALFFSDVEVFPTESECRAAGAAFIHHAEGEGKIINSVDPHKVSCVKIQTP